MTVPRRVDVKVDGKTVLANQRVDNAQVWSRVTRQGKLGRHVEVIPRDVTPPKPKPAYDSYLDPVRNLLVWATVTDDAIQHACKLPSSWKFLFTADPRYPVTDQQIAAAKNDHGVFAWGDCHSPGLMPNDIAAFRAERKLAAWYGEAESAGAFDSAVAGATNAVIYRFPVGLIGKLSALRPDQLQGVASAEELFCNETYRNILSQRDVPTDWRNANHGVGGNCLAVYESKDEGAVYTPLQVQHERGWFDPAVDSLYTEGMLEADWLYLRSIV